MQDETLTRREMLRLGGSAAADVAASLVPRAGNAMPAAGLSGLAAEYDRYDATGLGVPFRFRRVLAERGRRRDVSLRKPELVVSTSSIRWTRPPMRTA